MQKVESFSEYHNILTIADKILIIFLILFSFSYFFLQDFFLSPASYILIEVDNRLIGKFKLSQEKLIDVQGKIGTSVVRINDGNVRIIESPCPHKLCMKNRIGNLIVCIPNGVVIKFMNNDGENLKYDSISR